MKRGKVTVEEWNRLSVSEQVRHACRYERRWLRRIDLARVTDANDRKLMLETLPSAAAVFDINELRPSFISSVVVARPSLFRRVNESRRRMLDWDYIVRERPSFGRHLSDGVYRPREGLAVRLSRAFAALSALFVLPDFNLG